MSRLRYSIFWALVVLVFSIAVGVAIRPRGSPAPPPPPAPRRQPQTGNVLSENTPNFTLKEGDLVLSGSDGKVRARLKSDRIQNSEGVVTIGNVVADFAVGAADTMTVTAPKCVYDSKTQTATMEGEVLGAIPSKGQSFTADKVVWHMDKRTMTAYGVVVTAGAFKAASKQMDADLATGKLVLVGGANLDM
jgi:lipopolysaccharide export system protein LptA